MTTPRILAAQVLERVEKDGAYSHIALSHALDTSELDERDRALATELVYGTLTWRRPIDTVLARFVSRRLDKVDLPTLIALRLAAYQLLYLDRIPAHAAVNEAVDYVKSRRNRGAAGFANGALRAMLRRKEKWDPLSGIDPDASPVTYLGTKHSLPDWIARRLLEIHGDRADEVAAGFNLRPPLYFRSLGAENLPEDLTPVPEVPGAYRSSGMTAEIEAALADHQIVIQDLGSQLIGHFSAPQKATRILDACAGLGGKTLHLAELSETSTTVLAVEPQPSKLDLLQQTIDTSPLQLDIATFLGELADLPTDLGDFDLILLDAPCTGLGVIRRHPETRWRRHPRDIHSLSRLQAKLLTQATRHLRPGGLLVYSVCTFTTEEGPQQIGQFLAENPAFTREAPPTDDHIAWENYVNDTDELSLFPAPHDTDAFFAARLRHQE